MRHFYFTFFEFIYLYICSSVDVFKLYPHLINLYLLYYGLINILTLGIFTFNTHTYIHVFAHNSRFWIYLHNSLLTWRKIEVLIQNTNKGIDIHAHKSYRYSRYRVQRFCINKSSILLIIVCMSCRQSFPFHFIGFANKAQHSITKVNRLVYTKHICSHRHSIFWELLIIQILL